MRKPENVKVDKAVRRYIFEKADRFTVDDVAKGTKQNRDKVRDVLNNLRVQGKIHSVDSVKGGRGRPKAVYKVKEET